MNINPFANVSLQDYLEIVQIVDSTFPIGSFNHSFGMENYLREDTVTDDKGYEEWQEAYLASQFKYGEGLVIKLVYDAMVTDNIDQVWYYDKVLTVSTQARETRQGTKMIAKQMLRLIQRLHAIPVLDDYQSKIRKGVAFGNPAIVFALYVFNKGLGCNEAIALYGYSVISTEWFKMLCVPFPLDSLLDRRIVLRSFSQLEKMTQEIKNWMRPTLGPIRLVLN